MRVTAMMMLMTLAAVFAGCEDGKENCPTGFVRIDGVCVPINPDADADADVPIDGETDGDDVEDVNGDGDGVDGVDIVDGADGADIEEEEVFCERPCEEHEDCDDENICTEDYCAPITKCCVYFTETMNYQPCGDDLFCNGVDYCLDGDCFHEDVECTSDNVCTLAECNEVDDMCVYTPAPDGTSCDDGLYCTGEDNVCSGGYCQYRDPCPTFTGNPCTVYECSETEPHCPEVDRPDGQSCADDDPCNGNEFCMGGSCSFVEPSCFDHDPCTQDSCVSGTGECVFTPIGDCTNCTGGDDCDDYDDCTIDYCRNVGGSIECEYFPTLGCTP